MSLVRPRFSEGQTLIAELFEGEQASRIERLARHATEAHLAGVVSGLDLRQDSDRTVVGPGVALMPSGDVICLSEDQSLETPALNGDHSVTLARIQRAGRRGTLVTGEVGFGTVEDDGTICLGTVTVGGGGATISLEGRQLIGATGDRVHAPGSGATLSVGLNEARAQPELSLDFGGDAKVLTVDARRGARARGHVTIHPAPTRETALEAPALLFDTPGPPPEAAAPWTIRRVQTETDAGTLHELRLELHHPGKSGDPALSRLVIGSLAPVPLDAPDLTGLAIDAEGRTALFRDGEPTETGLTVLPPGRVAFAPLCPGPTDPAFAAALTSAMLQGIAWALLIATLNSGIVGVVDDGTNPLAGITVGFGGRTTITDSTGRFFLAAVGWPGETVMLAFDGDDPLGTQAARVGSPLQTFSFPLDSNLGEII